MNLIMLKLNSNKKYVNMINYVLWSGESKIVFNCVKHKNSSFYSSVNFTKNPKIPSISNQIYNNVASRISTNTTDLWFDAFDLMAKFDSLFALKRIVVHLLQPPLTVVSLCSIWIAFCSQSVLCLRCLCVFPSSLTSSENTTLQLSRFKWPSECRGAVSRLLR